MASQEMEILCRKELTRFGQLQRPVLHRLEAHSDLKHLEAESAVHLSVASGLVVLSVEQLADLAAQVVPWAGLAVLVVRSAEVWVELLAVQSAARSVVPVTP